MSKELDQLLYDSDIFEIKDSSKESIFFCLKETNYSMFRDEIPRPRFISNPKIDVVYLWWSNKDNSVADFKEVFENVSDEVKTKLIYYMDILSI